MAAWVDFDAVHSAVTLRQVIDHYGLLESATVHGSEIKLRCPFHENDTKPSLSVNTESNIFHCFGCDAGGDIIKFVVLKEKIDTGNRDSDRRKVSLHMADWFGIKSKRPAHRKKSRQSKTAGQPVEERTEPFRDEAGCDAAVINPPLPFPLKNLDATHSYLAARGVKKETAAYFELGFYGGRGIMSGRICVPLHDPNGVLIGYIGRWPDDEGWPEGESKYKLPSRDKGFYKSHMLFNLHRAREYATEGLIVAEGPFDIFELWRHGRRNVVSTLGSSMSEEQERLIVETVGPKGRVLIMYDPDDAGVKGARAVAERLMSKVFVRIVVPSG